MSSIHFHISCYPIRPSHFSNLITRHFRKQPPTLNKIKRKSHLPPFLRPSSLSKGKQERREKNQQRCTDTQALATRMGQRRLIWRQEIERVCTRVWVLERTNYDGVWFAKFMESWLLSLSSPPSSLLLRFSILLWLISSREVSGSFCFYQLSPLFVSTPYSRSLLSFLICLWFYVV